MDDQHLAGKFKRDSSGNVGIIFGLCAVIVIAAAGGAIDFMRFSKEITAMQEASDGAALAAVHMSKAPESERTESARMFFSSNHDGLAGGSDATVEVSYSGDEASVSATRSIPTLLLGIIGKRSFEVVTTSTAAKAHSSPVCMLALDRSSPNGFEIYGNAVLNGVNCAAAANSSDDSGMRTYGGAQASAAQFGVVGDFEGSFNPVPESGIEPIDDPFADMRLPPLGNCIDANAKLKKESVVLSPGTYCGGLNFKAGAKVRLDPGLYIVTDGNFDVQAGSTVTGDKVTIAFTGKKATLYLQGGGTLRLTAPDDGPFAGIVLFSESTSPNVEWATISGGGTFEYEGTVYLPTHELWLKSPNSEKATMKGTTSSHGLIAKRIWVQGNSNLEVTRVESETSEKALRFKFGSRLIL